MLIWTADRDITITNESKYNINNTNITNNINETITTIGLNMDVINSKFSTAIFDGYFGSSLNLINNIIYK